MKKKLIKIPEGIYYLTDYPDLLNLLTDNYYILNKVMTGCGATTLFLMDKVPTVLCVPRRELAYCKANSDEFIGKVHLYGDSSYVNAKDTSTVIDRINEMKGYVQSLLPSVFLSNNVPKIIVTYDSAKNVIQGLDEMGLLCNFRFVIDEFQTMFTDAAFRGGTEAEFMENLRHTSSVVFLSATPYIESYLDLLEEFKDLPYIELVWPESSTHATHIKTEKYYNGSPAKTIKRLIEKYRQYGYFESIMDEHGNVYRATEAVFFVNHLKFIIDTVRKNEIQPDEVNIICSKANDNEKKLRNAGLQMGHAPKRGAPHRTFTFVTKAAYEGVDFYSPCAYTYIFTDVNIKNLAIDISLDLAQIMGRQRLSENVFRYSATFYYKTLVDYSEEARLQFMENVRLKEEDTNEAIYYFNNCPNEHKRLMDARKYKYSQEKELYANDYISVIEDSITKKPKMVLNKFVMVNEIRAWEVQQRQYIDGTRVMSSIDETFKCGDTVELHKVRAFLSSFTGTFENRMKMYAEFMEQNPECKTIMQSMVEIPTNIKEYYNSLGIDKLRSLSWKEANIAKALTSPASIEAQIEKTFVAPWYSLKEVKQRLQLIYDRNGINRTAKASDLKQYLSCVDKKKTNESGEREYGYEICWEVSRKL